MAHVLSALKIVEKPQTDEAVSLARALGLELQAKRYEKPLAAEVFKAMTADEFTLWRHHCPTIYWEKPDVNQRALKDYAFDSVPIEVMRHWKSIKDNYHFDSFEVWTTERTRTNTDPLLIGIIGQANYLLARWGMESPDQLPLKEIAQRIYDKALEDAHEYGHEYPFQSMESRRKSGLAYRRRWSDVFAAAERYLGLA